MKFLCTQQNLTQGLSLAEKIIGRNFSLPILQNILISCEKKTGRMKLSSTDLEMGVEVIIPAKIEEEGSITVPAKLFSALIRNFPDEKIEAVSRNNTISIHCKNYKSNIKGESADNFPLIPCAPPQEAGCTVKSEDFFSGLVSVLGSVSTLDIKPEITGVYVQLNEDEMCFVATDSFRLSERKVPFEKKNTYLKKVIIPHKTCDTIMRVFEKSGPTLYVQISDNQIFIKNNSKEGSVPEVRLVSRVIDGEYPNYEQIIPESFSTTVECARDEIIRHVRSAGLFSSKINEVAFRVNAAEGEMEISSKDQDHGDYHSTLSCKGRGKEVRTVCNFTYVLDGLQNISSPTVSFNLNEDSTPVLISGTEDSSFRYLLMPIKQ